MAHTLGNGDKTQQPARDYEGELAAAGATAAATAAAAAAAADAAAALLLLLLHDPRCIAEHNPSLQTVYRFVFFGTHTEASNGPAAAAAAAVAVAAAAAAQQQ